MSDKNKAIEKCKKLIALAEGTHSVNEAETALNIMKQIASKNNLRINPKTLERIGSHINALRGEKVAAPKTERPNLRPPVLVGLDLVVNLWRNTFATIS